MLDRRSFALAAAIALLASASACSRSTGGQNAVTTPAPGGGSGATSDSKAPSKVVELATIAKDEKVTSLCADATTVYYTVFSPGASKLMRVARKGGKPELIAKGDKAFDHCALDGDSIYWVALSRLLRLPKTSPPESGAEKELFDGGAFLPVNDVAVDDASVFFTTQGTLRRVAKSGGKPEVLISYSLGENLTISNPTVDATHVFVLRIATEKQTYELVRLAKGAAGAEPAVIASYTSAPDAPFYGSGISAPVLSGGFVHWAQGDRRILRAPVDGGKTEPLMVADALVLALATSGERIAYASAGKTDQARALVHVATDPSGKGWKESGRSAFSSVFVIDHGALFGAFPEGEDSGGSVGRIDP